MSPVSIREVSTDDAPGIATIYSHYVEQTTISFEEVPPDPAEMSRRIAATAPTYPWLVAEVDGSLAGYAYARPYHQRAAYRWTCETGIYLAHKRRGGGIGRALYTALFDRLMAQGFTAAIASITVPNEESSRFHEAMGFGPVGVMSGIGFKFGGWRDVGYWQRDLAPRAMPPPAQSR